MRANQSLLPTGPADGQVSSSLPAGFGEAMIKWEGNNECYQKNQEGTEG
jgi:hypothetical protein